MTKRVRPRPSPKVLLAEGKDEQFVLGELMELTGVAWGSPPPVWIHENDGIDAILNKHSLGAELKESELEALGILVDADRDAAARWVRIRDLMRQFVPDFPDVLGPAGLIHAAPGHPRLGVWIMPDNVTAGMMESLLLSIRTGDRLLFAQAADAVAAARALGAPLREAHLPKAELHTWLAWQDPPGLALGTAAQKRKFDATGDLLRPFVTWFRDLFAV